ncbi:nicotinate-nucleotide adenylyltransferase [Chromobacterium haemolyticum]|uniref:nicotinate-nucleotide adenylyltransferase n=1 Tax=Chromobacterium haemolyticum TaxID=394935 RepID=UPI004055D0C6
MRLGLFGGTFDPIHNAHLRMADAFAAELALDQVRLIPAGRPYHRSQGPCAAPAQRLAMTELAVADHPRLTVDEREVRRPGAAYTIDTLEELRAELGPDAELWFLIGGDSLATLHTWKRWDELLRFANLAVALRPGFDPAGLSTPVQALWRARQVSDFSNRTASGTIRPLALPPVDIAATDIRQRLARGDAVDDVLPPAVLAYIRQHRLYQTV